MKNFHLVLLVLIVTILIAPSCNKPSVIGGDLLEQDQLNIAFTDSVTILAKTILSDSIKTYDINSQLDSYLCGDLDDPFFGAVKATNYVQARLTGFDQTYSEKFKPGDRVDSVILSIVYDTIAMYGNLTEEHTLNVYRLLEPLNNTELYYSDDAFTFDAMLLGSKTFVPAPWTPVSFISYYGDEPRFDTLSARIRVPLDIAFGEEIINSDSATVSNDSTFLDLFNGFYVETAGAGKESLLSFSWRNIGTRVSIYYTQQDTTFKQFDLSFTNASVKTVNFDHYGFEGSPSEDFVENTAKGDSLLFIQGMEGTNISFKFPYIESFGDNIINKAELSLTVAELPGDDNEIFEPCAQFLVSEDDGEGVLVLVEDVVRAFNVGNISVFGGNLIEPVAPIELYTYKLNLSAVMQTMTLNQSENEVTLTVFSSSQRANRSVIFGPKHSMYPAKLNLTYTKL